MTLTKDFWLGKYEVTQAQYAAVMGVQGGVRTEKGELCEPRPSKFKGDNLPVEGVSWHEAMAFCKALTEQERKAGQLPEGCEYTLPTEAQWEYACRAGTTTPFSFGTTLNGDKANCDGNYPYGTGVKGNYEVKTTPVGKYGANAWGLYDMHGNVWEWCRDWYGDYPTGEAANPIGPSDGLRRVLRGGSWYINAWSCRSGGRFNFEPEGRSSGVGFRVALSAAQVH